MVKYSYHKETISTLTQVVAAFDDCFVWRFTKDGQKKEKIKVRYVFGPKQRVLYDIVDQAKNITLPACSIEQKNIKRDSSRVQFKDQNIHRQHIGSNNISKIPSPIPVSYDLEISFICAYKEDADQIANNIICYMNPYLVISWKVPEEFGLDFIDELRTEVTWSGDISYENPTNIDKQDKYKIVANTSFNVKGWIFPSATQNVAPIYVVRPNFYAVDTGAEIYTYDYPTLSSNEYPTDYLAISAYPEFTNTFYKGIPITEDLTINSHVDHLFTFYGKRFDFNNYWYLSGNFGSTLTLKEIDTAKSTTISAYRIPDGLVTTYNDNIVSISLSSNYLSSGNFTFVTANSAAWAKIENNVIVI